MNINEPNNTRCGFVAIIGKPNVGKSTLLNYLLGRKISITSRKPQTTRHRILGIKTLEDVQIIYVDTPGLHLNEVRAMNRYMNRTAKAVLHDVDVIIFVVDEFRWKDEDEWILNQLKNVTKPVILAINKIDKITNKDELLPYMEVVSKKYPFYKIIPISANKGIQVDTLEKEVISCIPQSTYLYSPEQFTDRTERFLVAEIIREKLMRMLGEEVPYALTVAIEALEDKEKIVAIHAVIYVEKDSQKAIVIGKGGLRLKAVGQKARLDMEKYFEKKVLLKLWVKVKENWSDDERQLRELGYAD